MKIEYTTVHIPKALADLIDKLVNDRKLAYSSRSEFVKDAIRRFLEGYDYYPPNSKMQVETSTSLLPMHSARKKRDI